MERRKNENPRTKKPTVKRSMNGPIQGKQLNNLIPGKQLNKIHCKNCITFISAVHKKFGQSYVHMNLKSYVYKVSKNS